MQLLLLKLLLKKLFLNLLLFELFLKLLLFELFLKLLLLKNLKILVGVQSGGLLIRIDCVISQSCLLLVRVDGVGGEGVGLEEILIGVQGGGLLIRVNLLELILLLLVRIVGSGLLNLLLLLVRVVIIRLDRVLLKVLLLVLVVRILLLLLLLIEVLLVLLIIGEAGINGQGSCSLVLVIYVNGFSHFSSLDDRCKLDLSDSDKFITSECFFIPDLDED